MKKICSFLVILGYCLLICPSAVAGGGCSGCVIDTVGCFGTFGAACPGTLPPGNIGMPYDEDVTFQMPAEITLEEFILPTPVTIPIVNITLDTVRFAKPTTFLLYSASLDSVTLLPQGLDWECNTSLGSCSYQPTAADRSSQYGCAKICGIPCGPEDTTAFVLNFTYQLDIRGLDTLEFEPNLQLIIDFINGLFPIGTLLPDSVTLPFPQPAFFIMETGSPVLDITNDPGTDFLCPSGAASSISLSSPTAYSSYTWSTGATDSSIIASSPGVYKLTTLDSYGCIQADSVELFNLMSDAGDDSTICANQITQLHGEGGDSLWWESSPNLSADSISDPAVFGLTATTTFDLTVSNGHCTETDDVTLTIDNAPCAGDCVGNCAVNKNLCSGTEPEICQSVMPSLVAGDNYDESITFFFPEVMQSGDILAFVELPDIAGFDLNDIIGGLPSIPIPINQIVVDVMGLPQGISWECDQIGNDCNYFPNLFPQETQYGCIKLCGQSICDTPGIYEVIVLASLVFDLPGLPVAIPGGLSANIPMTVDLEVSSVDGVLEVTPPSAAITPGEEVTFTATTGFASYSWSNGETGTSITVSNFGTYSVTGTDGNGCAQTVEVELLDATSIGEPGSLERSLKIFPNPSSGEFTLSFEVPKNQKIDLKILTVKGRLVYEMGIKAANGINYQPLQLDKVKPGVYFIEIHVENEGVIIKPISIY